VLFLSDDQLDLARNNDAYPRDQIRGRLMGACASHLKTTPEKLHQLGSSSNLFVWNALISELSLASALTDDERYLEHALTVVRSLAGEGWQTSSFDEHIHIPFVLAAVAGFYDLHRGRLGDGDTECVAGTITAMADHLHTELRTHPWGDVKLTVWNHNIVGYASLGLAALAVDDQRADAWLEVSVDRAARFLDTGVTGAGMTWEGLSYCGFVFKHLGPLIQGLRASAEAVDLVPPGSEREARLRRIPVWYAHETFPRGTWLQNYNDSHWDPSQALWGFLQSFGGLEPDLCGAVWDRLVGAPGSATFGAHTRWSSLAEAMAYFPDVAVDPAVVRRLGDSFHCPDVGYLTARDTWDDDASVFTFNSGPLKGLPVHDQSDNNSFTFIARGDPLVIDSGTARRRTREDGTPSSALGHNLVFVDERAEHPVRRGVGVSGRILAFERTGTHVAIAADATASYTVRNYNPVRHALRHAVFVKQPVPYVVTYDDIQKDRREHLYEYVLHVPADDIRSGRVEVLHPTAASLTTTGFESMSPPFDEHVLWRFGIRAVHPHFVVLFLPGDSSVVPSPVATVERSQSEINVRLQWPHGRDELEFDVRGRWPFARRPRAPRFIRV
jgi:hypothetical protein